MKKHAVRMFTVTAAVLFLSLTVLEVTAHARAGGSRSFGSRGSRSYSRPASPYSQPSQPRQQMAPSPVQQPSGGGFMRSMAGGIMGGLLGGMLFSSLGFAGAGGMGAGGGIGLFEIILIGGLCYLIYRFVKKKRAENAPVPVPVTTGAAYRETASPQPARFESVEPVMDQVATGISHIRQMDYSFDEARFSDTVMDIFFKIQGGWTNRNLAPVSALLTEEMRGILQEDVDKLLRDRQINRLENIAVRNVEIEEAWQESGHDYITAVIKANLLDYTTDETSGAVVAGNKVEPVIFEEYWTFTRPVGNNPWKLSAIHQK